VQSTHYNIALSCVYHHRYNLAHCYPARWCSPVATR